MSFRCGVVIPVGIGREENLRRCLDCLDAQGLRPEAVVAVYDGWVPPDDLRARTTALGASLLGEKHEPGREQPRNVGFRALRTIAPEATHVWFLDSDLVFEADCLERFREGWLAGEPDRILIGPYDWMLPGETAPHGAIERTDCREASFSEHGPEHVFVGDLGTALGCFGGNLIWPVDAFEHVGGFHPELHHGRCEDGELGLRAAAARIPMSLVGEARGWHVWHPRDEAAIQLKNARDVPMLNAWHSEVEGQGFLLTEAEGARFDFRCECGVTMNSHDYWRHVSAHRSGEDCEYGDPASVR